MPDFDENFGNIYEIVEDAYKKFDESFNENKDIKKAHMFITSCLFFASLACVEKVIKRENVNNIKIIEENLEKMIDILIKQLIYVCSESL